MYDRMDTSVTVETTGIIGCAQDAIRGIIRDNYNVDLPYTWDWNLVVTTGPLQGKLTKRIGKFIHGCNGKRLSDHDRERIGTIARTNTATTNVHYVDFTEDFDWRDGDFGDSGSCFWGDNEAARMAMQDDDDYSAIRFYKDAEMEQGIARAWLCELSKGAMVVFNGYGMQTHEIAVVLAQIMEQDTKKQHVVRKISLSNYGQNTGMLYINAGKGFVVGTADAVGNRTALDFELEVYDENSAICEICNTHFDYENSGGYVDDTTLCDDCLSEYTSTCTHCHDQALNDNGETVSDKFYCDDCVSKLHSAGVLVTCDECDELHHVDNASTYEIVFADLDTEEQTLCDDCARDYETCVVCDSLFAAKDGEDTCPVCNKDGKGRCENCGDVVDALYPIIADGGEKKQVCTQCTLYYYGYRQEPLLVIA